MSDEAILLYTSMGFYYGLDVFKMSFLSILAWLDTLQKVALAYDMTVKDLFTGVEGLGESTNANYPKGFDELLEEYGHEINGDWKDLLLRIAIRGKRPSSKREWVELYLHLRRILDPKED